MADYILLITPAEIIASAFSPHTGVTAQAVTDETILLAQEKFIRPVLNGLYPRLLDGNYTDLLEDFIKTPLAQYVRLLMLPDLSYSVGIAGITTLKNPNLDSCGDKGVRYLCRTARANAFNLMKRAIDHIEDDPEKYPEYDPEKNILNKVNITSQFVL